MELESIRLPLKDDLVPLFNETRSTERVLKVIHAYGLGSVFSTIVVDKTLIWMSDPPGTKVLGELQEK